MRKTLVPPIRPLSAYRIGRHALRVLANSTRGQVAGVFKGGIYLDLDDNWCCITSRGASAGPANICTPFFGGMDILQGCKVTVSRNRNIIIGRHLRVETVTADLWLPPKIDWTPKTLNLGLNAVDKMCVDSIPECGLSGAVWPVHPRWRRLPAEYYAAMPVIRSLSAWLESSLMSSIVKPPPTNCGDLLGLGPGLTPSGDDFLIGMLIALATIGRLDISAILGDAIEPFLCSNTGPISCLYLKTALNGEANEQLHLMINFVLGGHLRQIRPQLGIISSIGHSSGWDSLAGAMIVLRALRPT